MHPPSPDHLKAAPSCSNITISSSSLFVNTPNSQHKATEVTANPPPIPKSPQPTATPARGDYLPHKLAHQAISALPPNLTARASTNPEVDLTINHAGNDFPLPFSLQRKIQWWHFASPMAQKVIAKGLTWRWIKKPPALSKPPASSCQGDLRPHILTMLQKGVILPVPTQNCFISRVFLVPKSSGGDRVIIDLSNLNRHIFCPTFKMMDATKLRNSIPKGAWFTSIDLSDAFHHIPIHPRFQKFLAFSHLNQLYFFQGMPFGLNLGPLIFTKIITEVLKHLHSHQIPASVYIDDWVLWSTSKEVLRHNTCLVVNLLAQLGFTINHEKSQLTPSQSLTYLGVTWNGTHYTVSPSCRNLQRASSEALAVLRLTRLSKKRYQKLLGTLNFVAPFIKEGKFHFRQVILSAPKFKAGSRPQLSLQFLHHLSWWSHPSNLMHPAPISLPPPRTTLWTDASNTGYGGVSSLGQTTWGNWDSQERLLHINVLECKAVLLCLTALAPPQNSTILIRSDNTVVVSLINKQGSNKSRVLNDLLLALLKLCNLNGWDLMAKHIPGHLNSWADSLSRNHIIRSEWTLTQQSFSLLPRSKELQVDLFAHPGNAKLPTFGCLFHHPLASIIDAISADWNRWTAIYLFPPLDLIPTCLKKLQLFKGWGLFIAPNLPSAPWWPAFTTLCSRLDAQLEIFQLVQAQPRWVQHETSLIFHAYSFCAKSTEKSSQLQ